MNEQAHITKPGSHRQVTLDAATPAEIMNRGMGMEIRAGLANSPFGGCLIAETPRGICHLAFFDDDGGCEAAMAALRADWSLAGISRDDARAAMLCDRLFATATDPSPPWRLHVCGTPFQLRVWRALLEVPPGAVVSYGKLAAAVGNPRAARATGQAVGGNRIAFLIPCHRVIRESGQTGHYRWGAVRKRAMLAWEQGRAAG